MILMTLPRFTFTPDPSPVQGEGWPRSGRGEGEVSIH